MTRLLLVAASISMLAGTVVVIVALAETIVWAYKRADEREREQQ